MSSTALHGEKYNIIYIHGSYSPQRKGDFIKTHRITNGKYMRKKICEPTVEEFDLD